MVDYAERGRANEKRHAAAKHRQRGVGKKDEALEAGRRVERSHSQAKHKARFRLPEWEKTRQDDFEEADWRKKYFREARPDLDPQSTTSKVLEFFGQDDDPYIRNPGGYDYRNERWQESLKEGNPDLSWFMPEAETFQQSDQTVDSRYPVFFKSPDDATAVDDRIASAYEQFVIENGREPDESEQIAMLRTSLDPVMWKRVRDRFVIDNGREPTDAEEQDLFRKNFDPRSRAEKNAGASMAFNPLSFFGVGDESTAAAMSVTPGRGSYDEELEQARNIQQRYQMFEDPLSKRNVAAMVGMFGGALGPMAATTKGFELGWQGLRTAAGLAPNATSLLGRAAGSTIPYAADGAFDWGVTPNFGAGQVDFESRAGEINSDDATFGAALGLAGPAVGGAIKGVRKGGKKAMGAGSHIAKRLLGRQTRASGAARQATPPRARGNITRHPEPGDAPPIDWPRTRLGGKLPGIDPVPGTVAAGGSVRGDVKRSFARHAPTRGADAKIGVAAIPAGAATGGIIYANESTKKRRKRYDGS